MAEHSSDSGGAGGVSTRQSTPQSRGTAMTRRVVNPGAWIVVALVGACAGASPADVAAAPATAPAPAPAPAPAGNRVVNDRCPVMPDEPASPLQEVMFQGVPVRFCCDDCSERFLS